MEHPRTKDQNDGEERINYCFYRTETDRSFSHVQEDVTLQLKAHRIFFIKRITALMFAPSQPIGVIGTEIVSLLLLIPRENLFL